MLLVHPQPPALGLGSSAPGIALQDPQGRTHIVVGGGSTRAAFIEFLSTSCSTCLSRLPAVCAAAATNTKASVVAVDATGESASALQAFETQHVDPACPLTVLVDPGMSVSRAYEVGVIPTVYVVDSHGTIRFAGFGASGVEQGIAALGSASNG